MSESVFFIVGGIVLISAITVGYLQNKSKAEMYIECVKHHEPAKCKEGSDDE